MLRTLRSILGIAVAFLLAFSLSAFAGESEAKKWVNDEFQPSTISKEDQIMMETMYWWGIPTLFRCKNDPNPKNCDIALVGVNPRR